MVECKSNRLDLAAGIADHKLTHCTQNNPLDVSYFKNTEENEKLSIVEITPFNFTNLSLECNKVNKYSDTGFTCQS